MVPTLSAVKSLGDVLQRWSSMFSNMSFFRVFLLKIAGLQQKMRWYCSDADMLMLAAHAHAATILAQ